MASMVNHAWHLVQYPYMFARNPTDALLSFPGLSLLVIPAFSSYSTSLNLLFFYLTWSTLVLSNSPLKVEFIGSTAVRLGFYVLPSLLFLLLDSVLPSIVTKIKEHGDAALAVYTEQGGKKGTWWKVTLVSVGNVSLGIAVQVGIEYLFTECLHLRSALKITTTLPMPWDTAIDLARGLFLREVLTYILHRYVLHSPSSPITPYHRSWQMSLGAPYSLVAHYDHPLPYLIRVFLPMYLPALLLRFHLLTYLVYLIFVSLEEAFSYSGYNVLPNAFVLGCIARRNEAHLMSDGNGNYGCWGISDFALGTSINMDDEDMSHDMEQTVILEKTKRKPGATKGKGSKAARKGT